MDCFGTSLTRDQSCDNRPVQSATSATEWAAWYILNLRVQSAAEPTVSVQNQTTRKREHVLSFRVFILSCFSHLRAFLIASVIIGCIVFFCFLQKRLSCFARFRVFIVFAFSPFSRFRFFPFSCLAFSPCSPFSGFRVFVFRRRHPRGRDTDFVRTAFPVFLPKIDKKTAMLCFGPRNKTLPLGSAKSSTLFWGWLTAYGRYRPLLAVWSLSSKRLVGFLLRMRQLIENTSARKSDLLQLLDAVISSGKLNCLDAGKLRGKLRFAGGCLEALECDDQTCRHNVWTWPWRTHHQGFETSQVFYHCRCTASSQWEEVWCFVPVYGCMFWDRYPSEKGAPFRLTVTVYDANSFHNRSIRTFWGGWLWPQRKTPSSSLGFFFAILCCLFVWKGLRMALYLLPTLILMAFVMPLLLSNQRQEWWTQFWGLFEVGVWAWLEPVGPYSHWLTCCIWPISSLLKAATA